MNWDVWHMSTEPDPEAQIRRLRNKLRYLKAVAQDVAEDISHTERELADLEPQPVDPQLSLPGVK